MLRCLSWIQKKYGSCFCIYSVSLYFLFYFVRVETIVIERNQWTIIAFACYFVVGVCGDGVVDGMCVLMRISFLFICWYEIYFIFMGGVNLLILEFYFKHLFRDVFVERCSLNLIYNEISYILHLQWLKVFLVIVV